MSNTKPTYAAIVNSDSTSAESGVAGAGSTAVKGGSPATAASGGGAGAGPSDAPPPYSAPSHPAQHQRQTQPHQTILPPPRQPQVFYTGQHLEPGFVNGAGGAGAGSPWVQPPPHVAKSRAIRRFWGAFFWAWVIWILVGLLIGGGISDVNSAPPHRHGHWDKHGDWHDDRLGVGVIHSSSVQAQAQAQAEEVSVAGDLWPDFAS
ncbi:hypothetical protein I317_07456 [Kwoniella heveanensis CBS 569]|nr:hypothetical protein I317_07456 [Kwoniella heveanensis CBS 569]